MAHPEVIKTLTAALVDQSAIRALFLSGSYGNGMADAHSDIDFLLVATDGATDEVAGLWRQALDQTGEVVLWWDRTTRPALINAITADWVRTDVVILKPDQIGHLTQDSLKPLFDPDGLYDTLPPTAAPQMLTPARALYQFEEFIRILGLLPLAAGREEYLNGVLGIFHLRNLLVGLLVEETGAPNRGGALHLNRLITAEQKDLLVALPPPEPTREAMIEGHMAYAAAYLPRARRMAARLDVAWPERFEDVTWTRLQQTLGLDRPYEPD